MSRGVGVCGARHRDLGLRVERDGVVAAGIGVVIGNFLDGGGVDTVCPGGFPERLGASDAVLFGAVDVYQRRLLFRLQDPRGFFLSPF